MAKNTIKNAKEYNKKARAKYLNSYDKKMIKKFGFQCFQNTEADLMEKLNSVENKSEYIKTLIRNDIRNNDKKI